MLRRRKSEMESDGEARDFLLRWVVAAARERRIAFPRLSDAQWQWIADTARAYRLGPMLCPPPGARTDDMPMTVAESFRAQLRRWSLRSLAQRGEMLRISGLFSQAGIDHVYLKGAALILSAYEQPGLRPLRDLDILVAPERAREAYRLLEENGYSRPAFYPDDESADKHQLPLLVHDMNQTHVEIHHRIGSSDAYEQQALSALLLAGADSVAIAGRHVPIASPAANFLHLVAHAVFHNLFDNGPQYLADMARLIAQHGDKLAALEEEARHYRLGSALALSLRLLERYGFAAEELPARTLLTTDISPEQVEQAAKLIVQDSAMRKQRIMMREYAGSRSSLDGTLAAMRRALLPSRAVLASESGREESGLAAWKNYPLWLWRRGLRYWTGRTDGSLISESRKDIALRNWLLTKREERQ